MVVIDISPVCLHELASALREIRHNTSQSMPIQPCINSLRLAVLPVFGSKWLLPRLKDFYFEHPGMTIHLYFMPHVEALDFNASEVEAAIYVGAGERHNLTIDLLKKGAKGSRNIADYLGFLWLVVYCLHTSHIHRVGMCYWVRNRPTSSFSSPDICVSDRVVAFDALETSLIRPASL